MLPTMKLGKRAPKHDARIPMLAAYTAHLPSAPASVDWSAGVKSWGVMRNDTLGDCTCAAVGHAIQVWTKNTGREQTLPDNAIVSLYSAVSGFSPDSPSSDQGAVETDVLNYWLEHKVEGHALSAFAALQPKDSRDVKDAIWLFGGVYIGLALPISAQSQEVWVVPAAGLSGDGAPGSWGGHAVYIVAYDARGLTCITWGRLKRMSWNFWGAYCDEAYGLFGKDWFEASGKAPSGFDAAALAGDMAALRQAA
ncbi:MAG: hypothetical protein ABSC72_01665 [Methylovirgula sp.]|jgi:hypothetical protein